MSRGRRAPEGVARVAPVRLALVLSGGVSLGAYVAGVVSEILDAIAGDPDADLTIDVIAGSSAGAVNAALAARALTVNREVRPFLRRLWVEALDVDHLLNARRANRAGILDGEAIEALGRALIAADPASDDRPAPGAGRRLRVGMTLSNLDGVPHRLRYRFRNAPDRVCGIRVHRDSIAFDLASPMAADDPVWEEIRKAAVASAAFPFAFPPVKLDRRDSDFPEACFPDGSGPTRSMWYADGSLFANEPIGLAKRLVEGLDDYRTDEWRYILVDPDVGEGAEGSGASGGSLSGVAGAVTSAVLGQAAAEDWARATETNVRVELFEALIARLPEIADGLCDPEALDLGYHVGVLADHVAEWQAVRRGPGDEDAAAIELDEGLRRIGLDPRFRPVLDRVETRAARTRLAKLIYVLEAAGNLRDKQILPLYLVAPRAGERLAGAFLGHFGGFLSPEWRVHDFRAGRRDAARLLTRHFGDVLDYRGDPEDMAPEWPGTPSVADAPAAALAAVDRFVAEETDRVLDAIRPGAIWSALGFLWKPAVRRWVRRGVRDTLAAAGDGTSRPPG